MTSRRAFLVASAATGAALSVNLPTAAHALTTGTRKTSLTAVLVHGAWADASSWAQVVGLLQAEGVSVIAPQLHLRGLSDDAAIVTRVLDGIAGPVLLAGHSYGGAVITAAASGSTQVKGLVYAAAFAPDQGDSLGSLVALRPAPPLLATGSVVADAIGDLTIKRDVFGTYFAQGLSPERARVLAASQGAINAAAFGEPLAVSPAWKALPSWYQISTQDRVINPDLERFMASRAGATTISLAAGHASPLTHAPQLTRLILNAMATLT